MDTIQMIIAAEKGFSIASLRDITDAIGVCYDAEGMIFREEDLSPEFFDLRTGLAGELFQKFTNYGKKLAIVVADPMKYGVRFHELTNEHRSHAMIRIVRSETELHDWL
jgi:hypothetical protein